MVLNNNANKLHLQSKCDYTLECVACPATISLLSTYMGGALGCVVDASEDGKTYGW